MLDTAKQAEERLGKANLFRTTLRRLFSNKKFKRVLIAMVVLLLVPAVQVAFVRFVDPPTTVPILVTQLENKLYGIDQKSLKIDWIDIGIVSVDFVTSVWVAEDHRFFLHNGFDWGQILAARKLSKTVGVHAGGASTITQQCARSLFLWQSRSWIRKGLEAYYTIWMELLLSKERIFNLYVNVIELGNGIYGIEAASRYYYDKSSYDLTLEESTRLAAMLPSPRTNTPLAPRPRLLNRQATIKQRIKGQNFWAALLRDKNKNKYQAPKSLHKNDPTCPICTPIVAGCSPRLQTWFYAARASDLSLHASQSYRERESQEQAVETGTSKAHFGMSPHNYKPARAIDVFFLKNDQIDWDLKKLKQLSLRDAEGISWGGNWQNFKDNPHFEETGWTNLVSNFPNGN